MDSNDTPAIESQLEEAMTQELPFAELGEELLLPTDGIMSVTDAEDMLSWMAGKTAEPPMQIRKILYNIQMKLQAALASVVIESFTGTRKQLQYLNKAEEQLFDPNTLLTQSREEKLETYATAMKSYMMKLDFARKFALQSKDLFVDQGAQVDKIKSLLVSLPQEKLDSIIRILEKSER